MENTVNAVKKFGMKDKLGYMFGDFGNDFTFILSSMFLLKFYTDVMGVSAALVGVMMMVARFVDAITDVTMGQIVDRSKPNKKGKFSPWIRRMCGPVALASFLMYASWFQDMPMGFKVFWMFFTYLLWGSICYTGVNIPYGSMASAITPEPGERTQLSSWRTIGATLASTVIGVVLPLLIYYTDADGNSVLSGTKMMLAALVCSIAAVVCYLLCYHMTTERVKVEQVTQKFSFGKLISELVHNRSLIGIVVAALLLLLAQLSLGNMGAYIYPNYFGNAAGLSLATMGGTVVTLLCATFTVKLANKIGKKELGIIGALISAAALIVAFVLHTHNMYIFVGVYCVVMIGMSMFNLVIWAMITDVIDDTEVKTGERSDGTIYSVYSFARKLGQACSSGLAGVLLSVIGYTAATAFEPKVVDGIYNITCIVPAAGFILLALALKFLYPLDKKTVDKNADALLEKRNNK
ncbi:MAG: glycoside-pentoside-hexuronide (GPH):cation symporter [Hespellia sp.]|nr:glycoside-pentoside-hexuronide (GPH):cation symporter [Hespellia sp.]